MEKVIVITGLAEGIGREVARLLAESGDTIAGIDVNADGLNSLENELSSLGVQYHLECLDVADHSGILRFRDTVLEKFGSVDTVVSNVGIGFFGPLEEIDLAEALKCLEINVIGTAAIFQAFLPALRRQGHGKLVAMSSLAGRIPFPFESIYTASKFAIQGLVEAFEYEVRPFGIKVALIEPSQVSTNFASKIHELPPAESPYRDRVARFIERDKALIERATTPEVAARKVVSVIRKRNPKLHNQVDAMSSVLVVLDRIFPKFIRDQILLTYMKIRP